MKKTTLLLLLFAVTAFGQNPIFNPTLTVTPLGNVDSPTNEGADQIIDGAINTKYLDFIATDGMGFSVDLAGDSRIATSMSITTANDVSGRDPMMATISGSNDGTSFTDITTVTIDCISDRFNTRFFEFSNTDSYTFYSVNFTNLCDTGSGIMQVSELQLFEGVAEPSECGYTLEMNDSFGDGWNGNASMSVFINGSVILEEVSLNDVEGNDESTASILFPINPGDDVTTVFVEGGSFPGEISYRILDANGQEVGIGDVDNNIETGTITGECPSCFTPSDLNAINVTDVSADLNWTDGNNPTAMSYDVEWGESGFTVGTGTVEAGLIDAMFLLEGLVETTSYDFYVTANCGADDSSLVAGPFTFMTTVSCFQPTDLAVTNITEMSADLTWLDPNDPIAMSYDVEWGESGFTLGMGTVEAGLTDAMFQLTSLDSNTSYEFYVTANCGADDSSEVSGPVAFTTMPVMAPPGECSYTLEMNDSFGDGWNGALMDVFRNGEIVLNDVALDSDPDNDGSQGVLPFEVLPGDDVTTVFVDGGGFPGEISYRILDANGAEVGTGDATTNIEVGTITAECPSCLAPSDLNAINITDISADLSWIDLNDPVAMSYDLEWGESGFALGTGTVEAGLTDAMFLLEGLAETTSYDFYVTTNCSEDILSEASGPFTFMTTVSCFQPTDLMATNITTISADLTWNDVNDPVAMSYDVEWGESGFTLGTGTVEAGLIDAMFLLDGLTQDTSYDFYVTANCDVDDSSEVSGPFNFITLFEVDETCGGVYLDSGGLNGGYNSDESITTTIMPDVSGEVVTVTFTYVDIESSTGNGNQDGCWDFLTVYDGPDTTSPVLAMTLCGEESGDGGVPSVPESNLAVGTSFTSTHPSGALTFVFTSDGTVQETGWEADITCAEPLSVEGNTLLEGFSFYPNPAQDVINLDARTGIEKVTMFNLLGQEVLQQKVDGLSNYQLNVSTMAKGIYLMQVTINGNIGVYRVMKN